MLKEESTRIHALHDLTAHFKFIMKCLDCNKEIYEDSFNGFSNATLIKLQSLLVTVKRRLQSINHPIRILVWGPDPESKTFSAQLRIAIYSNLKEDEDIEIKMPEEDSDLSNLIYPDPLTAELLDVIEYDLVIAVFDSPGVITEVSSVLLLEKLRNKLLILLNDEHKKGFSNLSVSNIISVFGEKRKIIYYTTKMNIKDILIEVVSSVRRERQIKFFENTLS